MRRALILTSEAARHPFRASLPPHVLRPAEDEAVPRDRWATLRADARGFASTYCAALVAIAVFIA